MLDKLVSYSDGNISLNDFEELNGIVSVDNKKKFLSMVENSEINKIIEFIDNIYNRGKDLIIFSQDLMILCRNLIINYYSYENTNFDIDFLLSFVEKMDEIVISLKESNNLRIIFETKILSFIYQKNRMHHSTGIENKQFTIEENGNKKQIIYNTNVPNEIETIDNNISNEDLVVSREKEENLDSDSELIENKNDNYSDIDFHKKNSIIINNCFYISIINFIKFFSFYINAIIFS